MINYVALEDVADVIRGVTFSKSEGSQVSSDDRLPVIRAGSIQQSLLLDEGQIWVPAKKIKAHQLIKKNDIVMCTSSGSSDLVGKCAKSARDWGGSFGAFCAGIRADESKCNSSYLYHFLCSPIFRNWTKSSSGANIKNIRASELSTFKIPLPPLEEQKRIAAVLDKADALRRKRQQAIDLTDHLLRSVFLDMFGDPVTNPKEWEKKQLKLLTTKIGSGATPKGGKSAYVDEGTSLIRSLNVHDNKFLYKNLAFITDKQANGLSNVIVEENDVLLNITGASVCRCTMVDRAILPARVNQHVCIIRTNSGLMNPIFLLHYLISDSYKHKLLNIAGAGGATREALTKQQVENLTIVVPPLERQKKFEEIVNKIQLKKNNDTESNKKISRLFSSLTQQAFRGELTKQTKAA